MKELQAALRKVESKLPRELRIVFNEAAKHVAQRAAPQVPHRTGRLASMVKPASTQRQGIVAYTSPTRVPYAGFIEFGGAVGRNNSVKRPFIRRGRFLFPAAEAERNPVMRTLEKELGDLIRSAGLG